MATNTEKGRAEREEASQSTIFSRKLQTHFCSNISDSFFSTHPLQQSCNSPGRKQKEEVLSPTSSPEKTSQQVVRDHEASMIHRKSMEKGSDCSQVATIEYRFQWHEAAIKAETRVFSRTCLTSVRQSLFSLLAREPRVAVSGPWRTALCMLLGNVVDVPWFHPAIDRIDSIVLASPQPVNNERLWYRLARQPDWVFSVAILKTLMTVDRNNKVRFC